MVEDLQANEPTTGWQLKIGVSLFGLSILLPVIGIPLVAAMELPAETITTVSAVLLVAAELLGLVAVAVMGKSGYVYLKSRVFGFFKQHGPPDEVSRTRYTIGLVMFVVPVIFGWLAPYVTDWIPRYTGNEISYSIAGDLLLLLSLFVLGGDFWDKLRALFIHGAKALFPKTNV